MRKIIIFIILLFSTSLWGNWQFDEERKLLLYNSQPFPTYQKIFTPIGLFGFTNFGSNLFNFYGWAKIDQKFQNFEDVGVISEDGLAKGYYFSKQKPANVPKDWIYIHDIKMWAEPQNFLKLYTEWDVFYEHITHIDRNIYNIMVKKRFYRIVTPYIEKKVREVKIKLNNDLYLVHKKKLKKDGIRYLFVFIMPEQIMKPGHYDEISVIYYYQSSRKKVVQYRLIYQKETQLNFKSF